MEFFKKAKAVRFRSHHNKYLLAGDDEESIWQDRDGTVKNAKWTVEINESGNAIRLKSCYGKYLTASNMPGLLGMKSKKVVQTLPKTLDSSVEWEPIREGFKMRLKMAGHGQFLRSNGGVPPWRNSITHDTAHRCAAKDWVSWDVDVVEICLDQFSAPKETTSDGIETNDDDSQQADTPSEIDVTSPPPPPSKHRSGTKKNKICLGVRANDLYSYFSMCSCPIDYHKKGSKSS